MPRNILKHKSYNVYSARNIDRVKRDERAAEKAEQQTRQLNQKERTEILRRRIRQGSSTSNAGDPTSKRNINDDKVGDKGNKHHEEVENTGVPLYTGSKVPWFAMNRSTQGTTTQLDYNDKSKAQLDPLAQMNKYIAQQKEYEQSSHQKKRSSSSTVKRKSKSTST
uniref:ARAD1D02354p n=1 Tax=Blastobotrys adeninivorans TaxID=409370 RepID=A0A060T7D4_BLAAD